MSRSRDKMRREVLYDDPVDCGIYTHSKDRRAQDDTRTVAEVHRNPEQIAVYGLFAGHGGPAASELCSRNFVPALLEDSSLRKDPKTALRNACRALEAFVLAKSAIDRSYYGTTLLFALIKDQKLYIANIGNSRAVLATKDGVQPITQEHDGSNAEEVSRVRVAGGFFQDGKVNNLVRVTRSIGDLELKERKHITFPNREMTEDIVIPTPDIFMRNISPRDQFLVMATAEVWEYLPNQAVAHIIMGSLRRKEVPRICAKKVANAALSAGARGPLTVMVMLFSPIRNLVDKVASPPRRRTSRPSNLKRHSSNAEQELQTITKLNKTPAFVLQAQAQEEDRQTREHGLPETSPVASPRVERRGEGSSAMPSGRAAPNPASSDSVRSTPFLSLDVPPAAHSSGSGKLRKQESVFAPPDHEALVKVQERRAQSEFGPGWHGAISAVDGVPSRRRFDMERSSSGRPISIEQSTYVDRESGAVPGAETAVVSRISELTASGATALAGSSEASYVDFSPAIEEQVDYSPTGPSKVRYREDGTVHGGKLGFLKEFGRTFVRRR